MARPVHGRLLVTGDLLAERALHVGGGGEGADTDLPLARDGRGDLYVPGTSLTGVFRDWCRSAFGETAVRAVWGYQERATSAAVRSRGHASLVQVEDAPVTLPAGTSVAPLRDGVGIDREWGVAAPHIKYDRAVLPAGSRARMRLAVELLAGGPGAEARAMVGHLLAALGRAEIRLGAARTRGLGRVRLDESTITIREQTLATRAGMLAVLRAPRPPEAGEPRTIDHLTAQGDLRPRSVPWVRVAVAWEPRGPLMVKAGADGLAIDSLPLVEAGPDGLTLLLPGSSTKGTLRAQAERVVRTVLDLSLAGGARPSTERFLDQLEVPLVDWLFGARSRAGSTRGPAGDAAARPPETGAGGEPRRGRGALSVADCYAAEVLPADRWDELIRADSTARAMAALDAAGLDQWSSAFHVAVDRWTGGAAKALLYTVLEPHGVTWEPIELEVDLARIREDLRSPALALLLLVLDDLVAGRIPLGFGTNRGMGGVRVRQVTVEASEGALPGLDAKSMTIGGEAGLLISGLASSTRAALETAWRAWIHSPEGSR